MKLLFDLLPVILFFGTFKYAQSNADTATSFCNLWLGGGFDAQQAPVICATAVAIVASVAQILWMALRGKKIEPMLWISLAVILVFGSLTIWLHNEMFIKWKPTILYWLFASVLLVGRLSGKNFIETLLGKQLKLPKEAWTTMLYAWIIFFSVIGCINLFVAYTFSTDTWVNFKLFGLMGLTLIFTLGIGVYATKYMKNDSI